ncbi:diaminopimelate dehydrogenase [Paenibacillus yanchengensis]|uniref:Meso-diaminopimelate D-dehydrogenase n=1 Tax=Paenibacillus yanchengensis TaxID=2035833 RepID=A0ABW4YGM0_9BACL
MNNTVKIGIVGYGNLGRGVELAVNRSSDMELVAVFTRREPSSIQASVPAYTIEDAAKFVDKIDVMVLCGGSATDLPEQGPLFARSFHTVDSFDRHAKIPEYFAAMDEVATAAGKISVISTGWDPGLFSLHRMLGEAILPEGNEYTFWGKGVSQGHSDAIRRVPGVKNGVQYTIPSEDAVQRVRDGENPDLTTREKHIRVCYVVKDVHADADKIESEIKTMPNYFADYDTTVYFITEEQLQAEHAAMPHGGTVLRSGTTGSGNKQIMEFGLQLGSNPEFTASVVAASARAAYKMAAAGQRGAKTIFDIPPAYLSSESPASLRKRLL